MTAPAVPVCYRHPGRETYVSCTRCSRPICPACMTEASVGFQCPECVNEGRRSQRQARTAFGAGRAGAAGRVTRTLIALNVAGLVVGALLAGLPAVIGTGLFTEVTRVQMLLGDFGPTFQIVPDFVPVGTHVGQLYTGIDDGAVYRMITSMFIHYGAVHLVMNMAALWMLGRALETDLGPLRFLALYLLGGLGGSVASYVFTPDAIGAGASGAILGLFGALLVVHRRLRRDNAVIAPMILLILFVTVALPHVSLAAHLGGFVTGGLVALGLVYAPHSGRTALQIATIAGTTVLLAAITLTAMLT